MARVLCACAQKVGTSCSHTKLQVARIAQRQSSSATQTSLCMYKCQPAVGGGGGGNGSDFL